jgi:hypothetical protein
MGAENRQARGPSTVVYNLLQFLHVLVMFAAVASALIGEVVLHLLGRSGSVAGIRAFMSTLGPVMSFTPFLFVIGLVFGLAAAIVGGLNLLAPWLLASYVVFAIAMAVGAMVSGPWANAVGRAAEASPVDAPSTELTAALHDRRGTISTALLMSAIAVIVFLMVVKPGA